MNFRSDRIMKSQITVSLNQEEAFILMKYLPKSYMLGTGEEKILSDLKIQLCEALGMKEYDY